MNTMPPIVPRYLDARSILGASVLFPVRSAPDRQVHVDSPATEAIEVKAKKSVAAPAGVQKKSASGKSSLRLAMNARNASSMAGSRPGSSQVSSRRFHCALARRAASSPPSADHCS